jgi:hypothetical protein
MWAYVRDDFAFEPRYKEGADKVRLHKGEWGIVSKWRRKLGRCMISKELV